MPFTFLPVAIVPNLCGSSCVTLSHSNLFHPAADMPGVMVHQTITGRVGHPCSPDHLFTNPLLHVFAQRENRTLSLRSVEQLFNFPQRHNWGFENCDIAMSRRPSPSDVELPQKGEVSIYIASDKKSRKILVLPLLSHRHFVISHLMACLYISKAVSGFLKLIRRIIRLARICSCGNGHESLIGFSNSHWARRLTAFPRWLTRDFSSMDNSAVVSPRSGRTNSGS